MDEKTVKESKMNPYSSLGKHITMIKEKRALAFLCNDNVGFKVNKDDIEVLDKNHYKEIDPNKSFYYYDGPLDDKTREFCATLLLQGKFYSQEEIDYMSARLGYNVDLYCGSYGCRHQWKRARIKGKIQDGTLDESLIADKSDANKAIKNQPENLRD